jgi:hypothetical protein
VVAWAENKGWDTRHDDPPEWAAMLFAYFDESFQPGNGHVVIAGFMGDKATWSRFPEQWCQALGRKPTLHMKRLRWTKPHRNKELLERLGSVPHLCGLQPIFASVRLSDYPIADRVPKKFKNGYFVALAAATMGLLANVPDGERVELIFEQQTEYAAVREAVLEVISKLPDYKKKKRRTLAKWGSIPKSILLEPADYLAYAIMQTLVDKHSVRAKLCAPILDQGKKRIGGKLSEIQVGKILPLMRKQAAIF